MQDAIIKYKYFVEDVLLESKAFFPDLQGFISFVSLLVLVMIIGLVFYKIVLCNTKYIGLRLKVLQFIDDVF